MGRNTEFVQVKPLVTVIVPVYNVEKYLRKCVDSICQQTYSNIEIILVNDGSKDSSPTLCDEYSKTDSRIRVIHKQNGGLSDARNAGLDVMKGEYVMFIDSDDYLEPESIELLVRATSNGKYKIAHMHSYIVDADYNILINQSKGTKNVTTITSRDYLCGVCEKRMSESVCDKMFHRSLFENRRFSKGRLNEDFLFLSELLFDDIIIAEVDYSGYNYYQRQGSISHSGFGKSLVDSVRNGFELICEAENVFPDAVYSFTRFTLYQIRTLLIVIPWNYVKQNSIEYSETLKVLNSLCEKIKSTDLVYIDKLFLESVLKWPKTSIFLFKLMYKIKKLL